MKTEPTSHGTWLCTGSYRGRRFIAAGRNRIDAMTEGFMAIGVIAQRAGYKDLPAMPREQAQ